MTERFTKGEEVRRASLKKANVKTISIWRDESKRVLQGDEAKTRRDYSGEQ